MKKITIITMQLKTPGGIERFVTTLANMFTGDYEVEIIANYGNNIDKLAFPLDKKVKTTFLTKVQPVEISMKKIIISLKWYKIPKELVRRYKIHSTKNRAFKKYLSSLKTDYIITERAEYSTIVDKYYSGQAIRIATDHNFHQYDSKYIHTLLKSIRSFNYLVVPTKELQEFYQKKTSVPCHYIPNPLPQIPTKKSSLKTKNLLAVGRFVPEKDFGTLVDVMNIVHKLDPSIHLTIIGDGITLSTIKEKVKKFGLENTISLPGFFDQKLIEKYYYDSALFIMTSKTEAFGLALTEAMSYGIPCIAFDRASGARALISPQIGVLIPDSNINKMSDIIVYLLNNREKLLKYQNNINKLIQKYSQSTIKASWKKILN